VVFYCLRSIFRRFRRVRPWSLQRGTQPLAKEVLEAALCSQLVGMRLSKRQKKAIGKGFVRRL